MATSELVVTRFAPSPTGHLHIGGARSALFCWAFARRAKEEGKDGRFMIRIEDTDQARSSDESARGILDDLAWLGIGWDDGPVLRRHQASGIGHQGKAHGAQEIGGDSRKVGPYFQAQRVGLYNAYVEALIKAGQAYPAFESSEELEARRKAAVAAKQTYRYERPADIQEGVFNEARWKRAQGGEAHVVRFVAPRGEIVVHDTILGDVNTGAGELDDLVIRKADGFPTYHFAVVIDDELMGVTHVLRAQEHLANTPRHVAMQRGLVRLDTGLPFRTPVYGHMPVICNMDGSKMSKRDKAKAARKAAKDAIAKDATITPAALGGHTGVAEKQIADFLAGQNDSVEIAEALAKHFKVQIPEIEIWDFRRSGYLPEVIINFIALLGWNPGMKSADGKDLEKFDLEFIGKNFAIERVGKSSSKFDRNKLMSFNADAIGAMGDDEFVEKWRAWLAEYEPDILSKLENMASNTLSILAPALKPRVKTFRDTIKALYVPLVEDDGYVFDVDAVNKSLLSNCREGVSTLFALNNCFKYLHEWTPHSIHESFEKEAISRGYTTPRGPNLTLIAQPVRVAISGVAATPPLPELLAVLGRERTIHRIDRCLSDPLVAHHLVALESASHPTLLYKETHAKAWIANSGTDSTSFLWGI